MRTGSPEDVARRLRRALDGCGATDLLDTLPAAPAPEHLLRCLPRFDSVARTIVGLLALGRSVSLEQCARPALSGLLDALAEFGLLRMRGQTADLDGLSLYRVHGLWLLADKPRPSPTLYFGEDSLALARRIPAPAQGSALDLCAGPGVQSLVMAARGYPVHAVDINPIATALSVKNAELNGLSDRIDSITGDLYRTVGLRDDYRLIVANPPLLPIPDGMPYPFVGDGGPTGLSIANRVLSGARDRLAEDGQILAVCATRADDHGLMDTESIVEAASDGGVDVIVTAIQAYEVTADSSWVRTVAATSGAAVADGTVDPAASAAELERRYREDGVSGIATVLLRARRGAGRVWVQDLRDPTTDPPQPWVI